jgi:hypothetical protein
MERNPAEPLSCKLQIYVSGSWLDMLYFEPAQRERVTAAITAISGEASNSVIWRVIHVRANPADWLTTPARWQSVTDRKPAPLEDVLVSVSMGNDEPPTVFMAYRKAVGEKTFYVSGTSDHIIPGIYAWKHVDEPAPAPNSRA